MKSKLNWKATYKNRYVGVKGRYWDFLSDFIRLRDVVLFGTCITCGKKFKSWNEGDAGHYISAGNCGFSLLFDEMNIHAECSQCNAWNSNHQITYRENLDKRYGKGTAKKLEERYKDYHFKGKTYKEWTPREYKIKLEELKVKITQFAIEHNFL